MMGTEPLMKLLLICLAITAVAGSALAQGMQLKDLPAAVRQTVESHLKGGEIKKIAKEGAGY